jgi:hypothetical protein
MFWSAAGDGEEAFEQGEFLVAGGQALEFAGDEETLGAAEELVLRLGHLHDEEGLLGRQAAFAGDDALHQASFFVADVQVGAGGAAEKIGEGGQVAGPVGGSWLSCCTMRRTVSVSGESGAAATADSFKPREFRIDISLPPQDHRHTRGGLPQGRSGT